MKMVHHSGWKWSLLLAWGLFSLPVFGHDSDMVEIDRVDSYSGAVSTLNNVRLSIKKVDLVYFMG